MKRKVFILSDATGDTARKVVEAGLKQFVGADVTLELFPLVLSDGDIEDLVERAAKETAVLVHTLVNPQHRQLVTSLSVEAGVEDVDLMGPLIAKLGSLLHVEARALPGGLYQVDDAYFRRIEAVEFAVKNDDGQHPRNLYKADIVLVGISRTSKTPLCTYLAQRGLKVANVPLVMGIEPPGELFRVDQEKIFALSIEADALFRIRQARLQSLGMPSDTAYGMRDHIEQEIEYARQMFGANTHWPVLDVTDRAIEETAAELLNLLQQRERRRAASGA